MPTPARYKVQRKALGARVLPKLVDKLAAFVAKQTRGSLGWFEGLTIEPISGKWSQPLPEKLRTGAIVLALLPDGERVCLVPAGDQTPVVFVQFDCTYRLLAPSLEAFLAAWAKGTSSVPTFDHDGSIVVARHGRSAATTTSVPSVRKELAAWLRTEGVKPRRNDAFDLDAYLGTRPAPDFGGKVPRAAKLEAGMLAGKRTAFADYGTWLAKQGHPLADVIAADAAAMAEASRMKVAKNLARATFQTYVKTHLAPRYARLANNMIHFTDPAFPSGMGFRYGFLEELDTFSWTPAMCEQARALLADDHARWIVDLTPRSLAFDDLALVGRFQALRRLDFRWTDIREVSSLAPLAGLRHLKSLNMKGSAVADLSPLRKVPVVQLYLAKTAVVDLSPLARHPTLECIDLGDTRVTDVRPLMTCPRLCQVGIWDAKVSAADAAALVAAMKKTKARPTSDQRYLIDGYSRGVSHNDVMWV